MSDAAERRRNREATWTAPVFRGAGVHEAMGSDAEAEWAALTPSERLALSWERKPRGLDAKSTTSMAYVSRHRARGPHREQARRGTPPGPRRRARARAQKT